MTIILYNTRTRAKQRFEPIDRECVRMYVCGPTVYDDAHIGNARPVIVFDLLYRLLRHAYGEAHIRYVRNITDVDDKINARAAQEGLEIGELTGRTTRRFHADIAALGCLPPDVEPRATAHVGQMKALIETLIAKGHAYTAQDHALFHVPSMPDYGKLSGRPLEEMQAGARVEVAPYKKDPMDFVLWKPSREGEPAWDSPAGIKAPGRPGWHIECSAMAAEHLGETFDIHGGGIDLVFPHHENEVAQSTCGHGTAVMANVWMHNGYLQVEGEKMSKSLGNFITIRDLLKEWPGEVVRLAMLRTHYRQPIDWTVRGLEESQKVLDNWYSIVGDMQLPDGADPGIDDDVLNALKDDLNTPKAIALLHDIAGQLRGPLSGPAAIERKQAFKATCGFIGLLHQTRSDYLADHPRRRLIDKATVDGLIAARQDARNARDFAEADRIRDELAGMGVAIKDGPEGTTWEVAR